MTTGIINLTTGLSCYQDRKTLMHEIIHSFGRVNNYNWSESMTEHLTAGILELIIQNRKELDRIIFKEKKEGDLVTGSRTIKYYMEKNKSNKITQRSNKELDVVVIKGKFERGIYLEYLVEEILELIATSNPYLQTQEFPTETDKIIYKMLMVSLSTNFVYFYKNNEDILDWFCNIKKAQKAVDDNLKKMED